MIIEANLRVGLDEISSEENREKGFVNASFVDVTGINAVLVGVAGILSFRSVNDWPGREQESGVPRNV